MEIERIWNFSISLFLEVHIFYFPIFYSPGPSRAGRSYDNFKKISPPEALQAKGDIPFCLYRAARLGGPHLRELKRFRFMRHTEKWRIFAIVCIALDPPGWAAVPFYGIVRLGALFRVRVM